VSWFVLGIGMLASGFTVALFAVDARTDAQAFNRWAAWAGVLALPMTALGTALVLFDKIRRRRSRRWTSTVPWPRSPTR
jgi:hypothetical protein